jgi:hypothetical protein
LYVNRHGAQAGWPRPQTFHQNKENVMLRLEIFPPRLRAGYGLAQRQTANGALLFEVPDTAQQATLPLKSTSTDFTEAVKVELTLPALP